MIKIWVIWQPLLMVNKDDRDLEDVVAAYFWKDND